MAMIEFTDEKLKLRLQRWRGERGVLDLSPEAQSILSNTFKEGWAACMEEVFDPAINLCLVFMRMARLRDAQNGKIVLDEPALSSLLHLCREVVGEVDIDALIKEFPDVDLSEDET